MTMGVAPRILPQFGRRQIRLQVFRDLNFRSHNFFLIFCAQPNRIIFRPPARKTHCPPPPKNSPSAQVDSSWQTDFAVAQTQMLAHSLKHLTGRDLLPGNFPAAELAEKTFHAPFVLVSHGTQADPVLNYGNAAALALWEMSWDEFTRTPSRLTAEAPNREERARLLAAVTRGASLTIIPACGFPKPGGGLKFPGRPSGTWLRRTGHFTDKPRCFANGNSFNPTAVAITEALQRVRATPRCDGLSFRLRVQCGALLVNYRRFFCGSIYG